MTSAFSQINTTSWIKNCVKDANNKENCSIAIKNEVEDKDKKKLTLSTIFVLKGEQNVASKDKDGKNITTKKPAVIFVANLPLNVDLTVRPQLQIDDKKAIDLTFTNCNQNDGCKTISVLSNAVSPCAFDLRYKLGALKLAPKALRWISRLIPKSFIILAKWLSHR